MKEFILYLFKIIMISFVSALIIQTIVDTGLKKINSSIYEDWNKILRGGVNTELLILGSSRGSVCFNPEIFKEITGFSSFNLSFNAGGYNVQNTKYNIYLNKNKKPKVIIQNIDLAHFSLTKKLPEQHQFLPFTSNNLVNKSFSNFDKYFAIYKYIPLFKYNSNKKFIIKGIASFFGINQDMPIIKNGYAPKNIQYKEDKHNLVRLKEMKNEGVKKTQELLEVENIIAEQASEDTEVFIVWAPEFKSRLVYSNPLMFSIKKRIEALSNNNINIHFLDFSNDSLSLNKKYFYDTFHLNSLGANLFSIKVANKVNHILNKEHAF